MIFFYSSDRLRKVILIMKQDNRQKTEYFFNNIVQITKSNDTSFKALFDNHPDAVFLMDCSGNIQNYNKAMKDISGYNDSELSGDFSRYLVDRYRNKRMEYFQRAIEGIAQNYIVKLQHKNGHQIDVDVTYVPIFNHEKKVTGIYGIAKDITNYVNMHREIKKINHSLELAQKVGNIGNWNYEFSNNHFFWSNQIFNILGIESSENLVANHKTILEYIHPDDRNNYEKTFDESIKNYKSYSIEYRILRKDGKIRYIHEQTEVMFKRNKKPLQFIGTLQDITERKLVNLQLIESEQRFKNIYNNLEAGIWSFDVQNNVFLLFSSGVEGISGYTSNDLLTRLNWDSIVHPDDFLTYKSAHNQLLHGKTLHHQYRIFHKNGEIRWVQDQTIPMFNSDGNLVRLDGIVTDITEHKKSEELIKYIANHDYLTGLPNRRMFEEQINALIASSANKDPFAICIIDINNFKDINQSFGNKVADKLLLQYSKRISNIYINLPLLARMNGDEFGMIIKDIKQTDNLLKIAKEIISKLNEPFIIDDYEFNVSSTIGVSTYPNDGETLEELLKNANSALYRAFEKGTNRFEVFSVQDIRSYKATTLQRDLPKAIQNNELFIHFQPRVNTNSGKMVGAEALIRWNHPVWGYISPVEFIPIAEESGFINEIGDWIFEQVCQFLKETQDKGLPIIPISINQSAKIFLKKDWLSTIIKVLKETKVPPSLIEFEITESAFIYNNEKAKEVIDFLRTLGIKVILDDFGTGYSSLSYLMNYPIDTIKIDKSFVQNYFDKKNETIIKSIIYLARGLNMNIVAEGVETMQQLSFLKHLDCQEIQGYLFEKPIPKLKFQQLLENSTLKPVENSNNLFERIQNRRTLYEINLIYPLSSLMTLSKINGQDIELGMTEILIEDLGLKGMKILANLNLSVNPSIIYRFETTILNQKVNLIGHIVWKQEIRDVFQYGLEFTMEEAEKVNYSSILKNFVGKYEKDILVPDCNFVLDDKISYLKRIKE